MRSVPVITAWIGSLSFLAVSVLYILLVCGLPLGEFAMGGKHKIMPAPMRAACAVSVLVQLAAIMLILQAGHIVDIGVPDSIATGGCYVFAAYLLLNTIMNGLSRSNKEKYTMTPLSLIAAICFFLTALNS